jgi:hypothetical protein
MIKPARPGQIRVERRLGWVKPIGGRERGRVLAWSDEPAAAAKPSPLWRHAGLILVLVLPLFGQFFHYMVDAGPFYFLSKAWPFMTLPLALHGLMGGRTPPHVNYIACLAYVLGVTPVLSIYWLGNSVVDAIGTTIKVWPITYYFSLLSLLMLLRPSPAVLRRSFVILGIVSFAALWLLWIVVPTSRYATDPEISKLFLYETERGYRIYMPETFTMLLMFMVAHRAARHPRLWHAGFILFGFASLLIIYKQRLAIAAAAAVTVWILYRQLPRLWRSLGLIAAGFGGIGAVVYAMRNADKVAQALGGSLSIRQTSMNLLWHYLADEPLRWVFGAGGATRFGTVTMADIVGRKDFYLADLGWAGVIFEYGAVGSLLLFGLYMTALRRYDRSPSGRSMAPDVPEDRDLYAALRDYALYLLLSTAVYSPVFTPGELASVTALILYLGQGRWRSDHPVQQPRQQLV